MSRVEEYLNSIQKKELIYLFLSIPIVVFIICYNFIYPKIDKEISSLQKQKKAKHKQLIDKAMEIRKIKQIEKTLRPTEKKLNSLEESFKYIKYNVYSLKILNLNNNRTYLILSKLLNKSKLLHLHASFKINWNTIYKPFTKVLEIEINGNGNFVEIVKYLRYIENMDLISKVSEVEVSTDKSFSIKPDIKYITKDPKTTYFHIKLTIMGIK